jgi:hypothetical protein
MCGRFGYKKITPEDKAKIFGLNAAKIYGVNVKDKRNPLPDDTLDKLRSASLHDGGMRVIKSMDG